jgi:tungstate transport system substrate-binding protein
MFRPARFVVFGLAWLLASAGASARPVHLATTAQIDKSGVLKQLLPKFKQASGLDVQVVAGTPAQVADLARRGEVDLLLIDDDRPEVDKLVAQGTAGKRIPLMFNEFLLVGPKSGTAGARGKDIVAAFKKLDAARALFISRGDQSITHSMEQRLWTRAGMKTPKGGGHRECGCGMGGALDIAATAFGYTLADKATWAAFRNRVDLEPLVEGDPQLVLGYSILPVNPPRSSREKTDEQKAEEAKRKGDLQKLVQWFTSAPAKAAIAAYRIGGQQFFFPKAAGK